MFACGDSAVWVAPFFEKLAHFLTFVVKIGVVTAKAPQSKKLRGWNGKVSKHGPLTGRWFKKYFSAWRRSLLGITVYKDVISMVKMILFLPEKLKVRKISSAWLLSLIYEGSDC